jgi:hypothetical protein
MKSFRILLVAVAIMCVFPFSGFAQGFFGTGMPTGFNGLSFPSSNSSACVNDVTSALTSTPTLYFGWLEHQDRSSWALQRGASKGTATWPLRGFWFGATKDVTFDAGPGILVSGGIFVPRRVEGAWFSSPDTTSFPFEIPSYNWWYVDGLVKARVPGNLELLAGFRWDHTSTRVDYSDNTSDDYILNSYIPIIGTQVSQPFSNGSILVRVVGSPVVFGTMKYHFWTRTGYSEEASFPLNTSSSFLEVLADYRVKLTGDLKAGCFAKWNWLRGRTDDRSLSDSTTESVSWGVDIKSWTLGGDISLAFSCPI